MVIFFRLEYPVSIVRGKLFRIHGPRHFRIEVSNLKSEKEFREPDMTVNAFTPRT